MTGQCVLFLLLATADKPSAIDVLAQANVSKNLQAKRGFLFMGLHTAYFVPQASDSSSNRHTHAIAHEVRFLLCLLNIANQLELKYCRNAADKACLQLLLVVTCYIAKLFFHLPDCVKIS